MLRSPGTLVVLIKSKLKDFQPLDLLFAVVMSALGADPILDHDTAILVELVRPVPVGSRPESDQARAGLVLVVG